MTEKIINTANLEKIGDYYNIPLYTDGEKYYGFIGGYPVEASSLSYLKTLLKDLLTETN